MFADGFLQQWKVHLWLAGHGVKVIRENLGISCLLDIPLNFWSTYSCMKNSSVCVWLGAHPGAYMHVYVHACMRACMQFSIKTLLSKQHKEKDLGSQVANQVFAIRLDQWLGWVFEPQERKERVALTSVWPWSLWGGSLSSWFSSSSVVGKPNYGSQKQSGQSCGIKTGQTAVSWAGTPPRHHLPALPSEIIDLRQNGNNFVRGN